MYKPYTLPLQIQSVHHKGTKFDLYVPRIVSAPNEAAQKRMNEAINNLVHKTLAETGYFEDPNNFEINGFYEIKTNERGILSLTLVIYGYPYHAAHGMTYIRALTFDIETGKSYTLAELFKPGSDYVGIISKDVREQIRQRGIEPLEPFTEIRPDQDYYIADKSIVIYFQLYEMTPYVDGFPMFPISLYSLEPIIPENGLLQPLLIHG